MRLRRIFLYGTVAQTFLLVQALICEPVLAGCGRDPCPYVPEVPRATDNSEFQRRLIAHIQVARNRAIQMCEDYRKCVAEKNSEPPGEGMADFGGCLYACMLSNTTNPASCAGQCAGTNAQGIQNSYVDTDSTGSIVVERGSAGNSAPSGLSSEQRQAFQNLVEAWRALNKSLEVWSTGGPSDLNEINRLKAEQAALTARAVSLKEQIDAKGWNEALLKFCTETNPGSPCWSPPASSQAPDAFANAIIAPIKREGGP